MPKYFIYWKNILTNHTYNGKPVFDRIPKGYVDELNKKYKGKLIHLYSSDWDSFVNNPKEFYNKL